MAHYDVLGVPFNAEPETIRRAYRRLARKYHPDAGVGSSPDKFRALTEAYQTLSDPNRRTIYDEQLLQRRRPIAEPLIPENTSFAAEWTSKPIFHFRVLQYLDRFAQFEQVVDRMLRDIEELFPII
jgi:curved DNA-binding protein CbpA